MSRPEREYGHFKLEVRAGSVALGGRAISIRAFSSGRPRSASNGLSRWQGA